MAESRNARPPLFDWIDAWRASGPRNSTTRLVLAGLSWFMDSKTTETFVSHARLAKETCLSERCVRAHVAIIERAGWVTRARGDVGGQGWRKTLYRAAFPNVRQDVPDLTRKVRNTVPQLRDEVRNVKPKGAEPDDQNVRNHVPPISSVISEENSSRGAADERHEGRSAAPTRKPSPQSRALLLLRQFSVEHVSKKTGLPLDEVRALKGNLEEKQPCQTPAP